MTNAKLSSNMKSHLRWMRDTLAANAAPGAVQVRLLRPTRRANLATHNALIARGMIEEIGGYVEFTARGAQIA